MATKSTIVSIKFQRTQLVSLTSLYDSQQDVADDSSDPFNVINSKVDALCDLLGCTAEEAERIVLGR